MAEVDTSSYLKPAALPVQKSVMDQMQGYGGLEQQQQAIQSNAIGIDKQKLDLINQRYNAIAPQMTALAADPSVTPEKVKSVLDSQFKAGVLDQKTYQQELSELPQDPKQIPAYLKDKLLRGQDTIAALNFHFGQNQDQSDGSKVYNGVRASPAMGGGFRPSTELPVQLPPGTSMPDTARLLPDGRPNPNYLAPGIVAPAGPAGVRPALPVAGPAPMPAARPAAANPLPVAPRTTGPTGPTVETTPQPPAAPSFNDRFAAAGPVGIPRIATGAAPGVAEAIGTVAAQGGKDYASALSRAKNFQAELYPAQAALDGIKELGTQGVGPGTETLNNVKSAIVTWLPNVDQKTIDGVGNFEQTRKYLTQIARSSGTTGTNDQLAASFEANPSIKMSNAATENVLKSIIALKKMDQAQTLMFAKTGLPESEFTKWSGQNQNQFDARAFGFDMMSPEAKKMLVTKLGKDPKAYKRFEDTLTFAREADLIPAPMAK